MNDSQRVVLLRYLHERNQMPIALQLFVALKLLTSGAYRDAYTEMERMHHTLAFHFAPGTATMTLPAARFPWLRVGFFGILGAIAVASSLLYMQGRYWGKSANAATMTRQSICPICHRTAGQCPHCLQSAPAAQAHCS